MYNCDSNVWEGIRNRRFSVLRAIKAAKQIIQHKRFFIFSLVDIGERFPDLFTQALKASFFSFTTCHLPITHFPGRVSNFVSGKFFKGSQVDCFVV